ncbi:MAG: methionyl-tRNA formyltransferase, partial [Bacteroidetes bacterium]|nr:methionyl-tRNA formyltransferase [Bacteroidota bacterium]
SLQPKAQQTLIQDETALQHAPKIFTETCRIDFHQSIDKVHNLVRGLSPVPGAFTLLEGKTLKFFKTSKSHEKPRVPIGHFETDGKSFLKFACSDGYISVLELQLEGKKKMEVQEFLRGYRFSQPTN